MRVGAGGVSVAVFHVGGFLFGADARCPQVGARSTKGPCPVGASPACGTVPSLTFKREPLSAAPSEPGKSYRVRAEVGGFAVDPA